MISMCVQILDEVYRILSYIKKTPNLGRAYKVTDELFDLSTMAMEYFREHIEPRLPEITCFGSDFLDITSRFSGNKNNNKLMEVLESKLTFQSKNCKIIQSLHFILVSHQLAKNSPILYKD